jgi:hypothetical protein
MSGPSIACERYCTVLFFGLQFHTNFCLGFWLVCCLAHAAWKFLCRSFCGNDVLFSVSKYLEFYWGQLAVFYTTWLNVHHRNCRHRSQHTASIELLRLWPTPRKKIPLRLRNKVWQWRRSQVWSRGLSRILSPSRPRRLVLPHPKVKPLPFEQWLHSRKVSFFFWG